MDTLPKEILIKILGIVHQECCSNYNWLVTCKKWYSLYHEKEFVSEIIGNETIVYLEFLKFCSIGGEIFPSFDFLLRNFQTKREEMLSGLKAACMNCHIELATTLCSLIQK